MDTIINTAEADAGPMEPPLSRPGSTSWLKQGLRAAFGLRLEALPQVVTAGQMAGLLVMATLIALLAQRAEIVGPAQFSLSGWLYGWASLGLLMAGVWWCLNLRREGALHAQTVAAWWALYWVGTLPIELVASLWAALSAREAMPVWSTQTWCAWALFGGLMLWLALVVWRITQALQRPRAVIAAVVLTVLAVQLLGSFWLRSEPWRAADEDAASGPQLSLSQEVFEDQERLLQASLEAITPRGDAPIQVFGLVYAPYAQDVFLRESQLVTDMLQQRFGAQGHVVTLLNHAVATQTRPWATPRNLQKAIQGLALKMDLQQDVLLVYFSSHGGADHQLASSHWPLEVPSLGAAQVRQWLDDAGIRYRAIGVSACFSGGWIEPLGGPHSLVMTAADAEHTSYGCGSKSELTFFTKAVFDEELRKTLSLEAAFATAVPRIRERELVAKKDDGFSNPQIKVGGEFRAQWARWMAAQAPQRP